ncbi:MAG: D-glycero-beta-D-manno-heptose 1,7-bisphosphate 7-phosphatase [Gammaproteobacteria bacterium]|jgi:D-glycero-D-manno-heptose 1,7-bisphosphate phosphatase|nr:D-glycero-beta-D-manno-heptose 1,7-bisphosphate 7-phosphatase [Gammaproteobacteria bacterium]
MKLVILDRDGVINQDSDDFIKSPEEWIPIEGSLEAIARLCRADYKVVVITNQSGIARGLLEPDMLIKIHNRMLEQVHRKGGRIEAIFFCPHGPKARCKCRKPRPGMLLDAAERLMIQLAGVPVIGDSLRDVQAARAAGAFPVLVRTGKGAGVAREISDPESRERLAEVPVFDDLGGATDALLGGRLDRQMRRALRTSSSG